VWLIRSTEEIEDLAQTQGSCGHPLVRASCIPGRVVLDAWPVPEVDLFRKVKSLFTLI
jgi:hypothetical protein